MIFKYTFHFITIRFSSRIKCCGFSLGFGFIPCSAVGLEWPCGRAGLQFTYLVPLNEMTLKKNNYSNKVWQVLMYFCKSKFGN